MEDNVFRDATGRVLADYPRPSVAVDTALLTLDPGEGLMVLQVKRTDAIGWALPGTFLHKGERLADAVRRSLETKAGVRGVDPHQLEVLDAPDRDERGWVLSVAHWAVVPTERLASRLASETRLESVDSPGRLIFDHRLIITKAVENLRLRYAEKPDPDGLLGREFTLLELRKVHQAVAGRELDRDWFRRQMKPQLAATDYVTAGTRGRPAELFRRRPSQNRGRDPDQ